MLLFLAACAASNLADTPTGDESAAGDDTAEVLDTADTDTATLDLAAAIYAPYANCQKVETYHYHESVTYITTSWADAAGYAIAGEDDDDADGRIDDSWHATRDADELLLTWAADTNADGTDDSLSTYTNEDGHAIRIESDDDADGDTEWVYLYFYDADDNFDHYETWAGEVLYSTWSYTWTTDGPYLVRLGDYDYGANGDVDSTRDVTFDQYPFQRRIDSDEDADGNLEWRYDYTYDSAAHVLSGAYLHWVAGAVEYSGTIRYEYDDAWRITSMLYEQYEGDETDSAWKEFVYDCGG